jgi:hypothetical protein
LKKKLVAFTCDRAEAPDEFLWIWEKIFEDVLGVCRKVNAITKGTDELWKYGGLQHGISDPA